MGGRLGHCGAVGHCGAGACYGPASRIDAFYRGPGLARGDYRGALLRPVIRSSCIHSLGNDKYAL